MDCSKILSYTGIKIDLVLKRQKFAIIGIAQTQLVKVTKLFIIC